MLEWVSPESPPSDFEFPSVAGPICFRAGLGIVFNVLPSEVYLHTKEHIEGLPR